MQACIRVMWGNRLDSIIKLPTMRMPHRTLELVYRAENSLPLRTIRKVSLGFEYEGAALFAPDGGRAERIAAVVHRVGCENVAEAESAIFASSIKSARLKNILYRLTRANLLLEFKAFILKWCMNNLTPLSATEDVSVESWLETTPYTMVRKQELLKLWEQLNESSQSQREHRYVKAFIKDETYSDIKYPRGIYSRTDAFKIMSGPIFRLIEKQVFSDPSFIKKVPIADRPSYIMDLLYRECAIFLATDFVAFESNFYQEFMQACEMTLYDFMTPNHRKWFRMIDGSLSGINEFSFGGEGRLKGKVGAKRMSGEMCTSLGNGFTNLMLFRFFSELLELESNQVVEGDDGLLAIYNGEWSDLQLLYNQIGMRIEINVVSDITEASFCGLVFDSTDQRNVTDIVDATLELGWGNRKYLNANRKKKMALLRSKALSMAHQYPGCPILDALAHRILFLTRGMSINGVLKELCLWEREQLIAADKVKRSIISNGPTPPGLNTRILVERLYGIPVSDQIEIESQISNLQMGGWRIALLDIYIHERYKIFWEEQVSPYYGSDQIAHINTLRDMETFLVSIPGVTTAG
jgi:hypothetical protein